MRAPSTAERAPYVTRITSRHAVSLRFYLAETWRHRGLVRVLAGRSLKGQYELNLLGFAWWLLDPLTFAGVYYVLFDVILRNDTPAYPLFLIVSLLPFKWLVTGITGAMGTVRTNGSLIQNLYFPRALLPVTELAVGLAHFLVGLLVVPIFMAAFTVAPSWHLVWLPVVIAVQFVFMLGLAFPSAIWGVNYRNLPGLAANLIRLWFYVSPGVWALERVDGTLRTLVQLNPLTGLFEAYRGAIMTHRSPGWTLGWTAAVGLAGLLAGGRYFVRREAQFGKIIQ